ncbi:hypothetical protein CAT7_07408 [Carnobacterium sp. AT7]|uniref:hypothetical protein n=1 Tax=Carnobacterium sp. AT7 TaxID=333990 RepID=UPI00015F018A|nr:hypothetical protein [Carnobacterium sp. AT7]EDP67300.1 hypothetical protein CAT7_07408 [Carnobacterium sp. AT7]
MNNNELITVPHGIHEKNIPRAFFQMMHSFLAIFVVSWMSGGLFSYISDSIPSFITYAFYAIWLFFAFLTNFQFLKRLLFLTWPLIFFYLYILYVSGKVSLGTYTHIELYSQSIIYLLITVSISLFYLTSNYLISRKRFLNYLILDFSIVGINTLIKLNQNPDLSRLLATGNEEILSEGYNAVGSYAFNYSIVPILLLLVYLLVKKQGRKIHLIFLALGIMVLLKSAFTLAILLFAVFSLLIMITDNFKKKPYVNIFVLSLILLLYITGFLSNMFSSLADITGLSTSIRIRFDEVSDLLSGVVFHGSDLSARFQRYTLSIDAFKNNVFEGTTLGDFQPIGGHSSWIDILAYFGLPSLLFFLFFLNIYKVYKKIVPFKYISLVRITFLYFLVLGILNTLFFSTIFITWFLFMPILILYIDNEKKLI